MMPVVLKKTEFCTHSFPTKKIPDVSKTALDTEHTQTHAYSSTEKHILPSLLFNQNPNACSNINKYHKNQK